MHQSPLIYRVSAGVIERRWHCR